MENRNAKSDLEDRLVDFACMCLGVCELLPRTTAVLSLEYQLAKSGTASAHLYGEARAAESTADFPDKLKLVLKEIRESSLHLKIIKRKPVVIHEKVEIAIKESAELMEIFRDYIEITQKNNS